MRLKTKTLETVLHETVERRKREKKKKEFGVVSLFGESVREWGIYREKKREEKKESEGVASFCLFQQGKYKIKWK